METTTAPGSRTVQLPGRVLTVRHASAADVQGLQALYDGLDPEDRHRRFFAAYRPTEAFLLAAATAAERGGVALVATVREHDGGPERIVADATCLPLPDGDGEFALTVASPWRGWVGPFLLDALVEGAAAVGMPNVEADVLVTNGAMLALVRQRGGVIAGHPDGPVVRVLLGTEGDTPTWPPLATGPRVLVEGCSRWVGEEPAADAGMQVLACTRADRRRTRCPALAGRRCPLAAAADVIVVTRPPDAEPWAAVAASHAELHPGATVCRSLPGNGEAAVAALRQVLHDRTARTTTGG